MDVQKELCDEICKSLKKDGSIMNLARVCVTVFECPVLPNYLMPREVAYLFAKELLEINSSKQE